MGEWLLDIHKHPGPQDPLCADVGSNSDDDYYDHFGDDYDDHRGVYYNRSPVLEIKNSVKILVIC